MPCHYALNNVFLAWNLVLYTLASGGKWNSLWQGIRRAAVAEMLMHFQLLHRRIFYATTYIHARSSVRFSGILCKTSKKILTICMKNLFKMNFWFHIMSLRYEKVSIFSIIWILPGIFTKTTFLLFFLHHLSLQTLKPTSCATK